MIFYNVWALIKIFIWITTLYLVYNYINVYQDPVFGLGFGFFGLFLISWGLSFFIFFIWYKIFSNKGNLYFASKSYKLSLLFGLFVLINLWFIIINQRDELVWGALLLIFIILQIITVYENE